MTRSIISITLWRKSRQPHRFECKIKLMSDGSVHIVIWRKSFWSSQLSITVYMWNRLARRDRLSCNNDQHWRGFVDWLACLKLHTYLLSNGENVLFKFFVRLFRFPIILPSNSRHILVSNFVFAVVRPWSRAQYRLQCAYIYISIPTNMPTLVFTIDLFCTSIRNEWWEN